MYIFCRYPRFVLRHIQAKYLAVPVGSHKGKIKSDPGAVVGMRVWDQSILIAFDQIFYDAFVSNCFVCMCNCSLCWMWVVYLITVMLFSS